MTLYLIFVLIAGGAFAGYVATRPDTFRVQRSALVDASPARIFPLIEDLRKYTTWSPYERLDPAMQRTFSGSRSGKGAVYEWDGNAKAGKGRMEIAHTSAPDMVVIRLDFIRPFKTQNIVEFTLEPEGGRTRVTWAMRGVNPYLAKLIQLFFSMDRMVGRDFETGLANLKAIVEEQGSTGVPRYAAAS